MLKWAEGFESGRGHAVGFITGDSYSTSYARIADGSYGMRLSSADNNNSYLKKDFSATSNTIFFGVSFRVQGIGQNGSNLQWITSFYNGVTTSQLGVYITPSQIGYATRNGNAFTDVLGTAGPISDNTWYRLEGKIVLDYSTAGEIYLKLDGQEIINATGVTTIRTGTNNSIDRATLLDADINVGYWADYDDWYVCDDTGSYNNTYLGDIRVLDLPPTADATYSAFTPSTGVDHYALIDEQGGPNDTDYVYSNVVGNKDTYTYTDLPANAVSIKGILYGARGMKNEAGARTVRFMQRQSSTDYERTSSDFYLGDTVGNFYYIDEINPATSAAWTVTDINTNAEFGFKIQS